MSWSNKIDITIDGSKINETLTNFPLLINLSESSGISDEDISAIFTELGNNYYRIKIEDEYNVQLPIEIENWDSIYKKAQLWVKVPTVKGSGDTKLTLYYDNGEADNTHYVGKTPGVKPINMVVNINEEGTYDTSGMYAPCVIKESDTSYKMWYSGNDGSHYRIMYATSTDGLTWSNHQMVLNYNTEGTYDTTHVYTPYVIKESDTSYKMWYAGYDGSYRRMLYAVSTDGTSWSNYQMIIDVGSEGTYDTNSAYYPSVIKESDTSYKMWYAGYDGSHYRILYCTSTDGINWSNFQLVLNYNQEGTYDTSYIYSPSVIKELSGSYKMWYTGRDGSHYRILYCTSTNGISWSNFQLVLNYNQEGTYDTNYAYTPCVIKENDTLYKLWYTGNDGSYSRILYATSEDGKVWTKNIVNRVWDDNFVAVYHMSQDPSGGSNSIYDSTSNANHGTPQGNMNSSNLVDGEIGKALNFDGVDDWINIGNVIYSPHYYTIEAIFKTSQTGNNTAYNLLTSKHSSANIKPTMYFDGSTNFQFKTGFYNDNTWYRDDSGIIGKNDDNLHYAASTYNKVNIISYIDDDSTHSTSATVDMAASTNDYRIGARWDAELYGGWWSGIIDEVRLSKIARSPEWIKATYYSNWDNLLYYNFHPGAEVGWLETYENGEYKKWAKRIKIDIDSTKVDDILVDFPVLVRLGESVGLANTDVTDVFDTSKNKIAITAGDGTSQLYTEIEYWSSIEKEAVLWTKVSRISSDENSSIYLYYDNEREDNTDYVGETGTQPAQNVWDDNFVGVWHMSQDPSGGANSIYDSTSNNNHGTPNGSMTSGDLVDGQVGKAIDFDGTDDYIQMSNTNIPFGASPFTKDVIVYLPNKVDSNNTRKTILWWGQPYSNNYINLLRTGDSSGELLNGFWGNDLVWAPTHLVNGYNHIMITYDGNILKGYVNGEYEASYTAGAANVSTSDVFIGESSNTWDYNFPGIIDEVRISKTARSPEWIKATYYSNWDSLLTFHNEQKKPAFKYTGYVYVENTPAARVVNLYRRSDGKLIGTTISDDATGYFEIVAEDNAYHYSVILPELTESYNLIATDKIKPES